MKKLITYLFVLISVGISAQNTLSTNYLQLTRSGSLTTTGTNQLYIALSASNTTLTGDLSISYGSTPLIGTQYCIWFDGTTIVPDGHQIYIQGQTLTSVLTGTVNQFVTCNWDGTSWTVRNQALSQNTALASYVRYADTTLVIETQKQASTTLGTVVKYTDSTLVYFTQKQAQGKINFTDTIRTTGTIATQKQLQLYGSLANPTFTGTVNVPTVAGSTDNSTKAASTAFAQAVATSVLSTVNTTISGYSNYSQLDTLKAGTINLSSYVMGTYNTVVPFIITGNIVLTSNVFPSNLSEITIFLPFSGSYTVTAGANMAFTTITGANTHVSVLTLSWNTWTQTYIQKSFSQN
jgi:hypothetical protein